jgi:5-oxoprolinase (ATP-hydrolysing)
LGGWHFWIDRGGTFTDIVAKAPDGTLATLKMLSENPQRYDDAATAGIKTLLGLDLDASIPAGLVREIKMGTTVATNALLERKGARTLLLVDKGLKDLLRIGHQTRPDLFKLDVRLPEPLYSAVEEVGGRICADGQCLERLDESHTAQLLESYVRQGFTAVAIALMHAWKYPENELRLAEIAHRAGFTQVSVSHQVSPLVGLVARASTTVVDAYLSPVLRHYVNKIRSHVDGVPLYFMQSSGGLVAAENFQGKDAILSGPAGGVVGAVRSAETVGATRIITFDMGGTSTDVAIYTGAFQRTFDSAVAGVELRVPMMAIETVAAGGGSILYFDGERFRVGPESAGADPGPLCYRRGGPLTVTDANVMCGKIVARHFPAIFGASGTQPLDDSGVRKAFEELSQRVGMDDPRQVAEGFLRIAVSSMAAAIKRLVLKHGENAADFTLQCFGGAGGQHACRVAEELGMTRILIDPFAGVLSAYGIGLADHFASRQHAVEQPLAQAVMPILHEEVSRLTADAQRELVGELERPVRSVAYAYIRYEGTDFALPVSFTELAGMRQAFEAAHMARYGFLYEARQLIVDSLMVEVSMPGEEIVRRIERGTTPPVSIDTVSMWSRDREWVTPVYDRDALRYGQVIDGPALIKESIATTVVEPGWRAEVLESGALMLSLHTQVERNERSHEHADPVLLEIFNNTFMAVAQQMGVVLANTSTSVNIKERLDFSCALFDAQGRLIANAPHVPVHLGAMGESVRAVIKARGNDLRPGDSILLNNPYNGGTHLPDVTVVTPLFDDAGKEIRFFVANRAHHADIGGLIPGSMPPASSTLEEEGVVIDDFLLVRDGRLREDALRELLGSARYPARSPDINVVDLKAQLAANETGCRELRQIIARYGWEMSAAYTQHVMTAAEKSVRRLLGKLRDGEFTYLMDDGAKLCVRVEIDHQQGCACIDFTGTSEQRSGNFNAPPAITRAVVLYVLRCLVDENIPLNEGCLVPIKLIVPQRSFLSPEPGRAVVAGNTEVSQAICNALLGALGVCASSQATMNNFLFGNDRYQYYETICGGTGAGPDFDGTGPVHSHMTNTRITDPEVLELRYPVRLQQFGVRHGSGGTGKQRGGDGAVRRIQALDRMEATIVSSRRAVPPFGLAGGQPGALGKQWVERADGRREDLPGMATTVLEPGDVFVIETPGGGGYGKEEVVS